MADRPNNDRGNNNHYDRDFRGNSQEYRGFQNRSRDFRDRSQDVPIDPPYIAFVGNLPKGLVQGDVMKIFNDFEVKSVRLIKDRETDEFKGYGYVEFTTPDQLKLALSRNGRIKLDNLSAPLRIDIAGHRRQGTSVGAPGPIPSTSGGVGGNQRRNFPCESVTTGSQNFQGQYSRKQISPGRQIGNRSSNSNFQASYRGGRGGERRGGAGVRGTSVGSCGRGNHHNDNFQGNDGSTSSDLGSVGGGSHDTSSLGSPRQSVEPHISSTSFQSSRSFPHYANISGMSSGMGSAMGSGMGSGMGSSMNYNKNNRDRNGHNTNSNHNNSNNNNSNNHHNNSNNNNSSFNQNIGYRRGIAPRQRSISNDNDHYSSFGQNRTRDRRGHYNPNERYKQSHSEAANPPLCNLDDNDRPKIVLKPRTISEPINSLAETKQAASIFGNAKPRKSQPEGELDDSRPGGSHQ